MSLLIHLVRGDENLSSLIFSHSDVFSGLEIFKLISLKVQKEREKKIEKQPGVFIKFLSADTPLHPFGLHEAFLYPTTLQMVAAWWPV